MVGEATAEEIEGEKETAKARKWMDRSWMHAFSLPFLHVQWQNCHAKRTAPAMTELELRAVDRWDPAEDGDLELQHADVLCGTTEQRVDIGVAAAGAGRHDLLELPEPPQHHELERPPPPQRHHPSSIPPAPTLHHGRLPCHHSQSPPPTRCV